MKRWTRLTTALLAAGTSLGIHAATLEIPMNKVGTDGTGASVGTVTVESNEYGLVFTPKLHDLEPGIHGFHVHAVGSCEPADVDGKMTPAGAAKGHWDPEKTGKHGLPWGDGHLGDLPALLVTADGHAMQPVLAPRIDDLDDIRGLALMVHAGGDNHSDQPKPLGGGGARVACGVIPK